MPYRPNRYSTVKFVDFSERTWPNQRITHAPRWCAVDLRDGNQALVEPMGSERKMELFLLLVRLGYKEIEVGFPAASQTDFDFVRRLIDENRIPIDVTIQVLVQARLPLIERTIEAIAGARRAIVHLYNSTSTVQRRVVFGMTPEEVKALAVQGTRWVKEAAQRIPQTQVLFQYSPESFTGTELEVARDVCAAVIDEWDPSEDNKMIINLPATVEMTTPNIYADQIEWMIMHLRRRKEVIISVHTHNDRGCAVAATELAMLAGAERVEGTLFGNGERTGNVDLVTLALNLYSQGIDPKVDFSSVPEVAKTYERCCQLPIHPRHPYAGELVFTAFSGSHQDAIRKGLEVMGKDTSAYWEVPYLTIDPSDIGRDYEPLVRINSQSGKGGVAFVLERHGGYQVPKGLAAEFSQVIQRMTDGTGKELHPNLVVSAFEGEYMRDELAYRLVKVRVHRESDAHCHVDTIVEHDGTEYSVEGEGSGPIDAFVRAMNATFGAELHCVDYAEHALSEGEDAVAVAYVGLRDSVGHGFGVGKARDIVVASIHAVLSAVSRRESARGTTIVAA